ncbi:MAG: spermidine/putrescine ABC transporter substrate-binding protein [Clostridia bacterium]|nr:spermidine/putrescine ABC transporter substrate-binding protein [Clostridia bacterium]
MKRRVCLAFFVLAVLTVAACLPLVSCADKEKVEFVPTEYAGSTLYVYNWGEYISDGSEGSLDVVKRFEETYGITVKYDYFETNEELYAQLKNGAVYDVCIPSDYMIERLIAENLLQPLQKDKVSHYDLIDPQYLGRHYDPADAYSIPYAVGMIGIVYNTRLVDEVLGDPTDDVLYEPEHSWDLLWNEQFEEGQIINFNNPRDAFGVAMIDLGLDVNTESEADWEAALKHLQRQKTNCIYLMDEVFNKMENGSAAVAAYYAGDCITMMNVNPDLAFFYPDEGTNVFVDAMCIPASAQNVGAAHLFIDFMLDPEIATQNANYISYASPNLAVIDHEDYDHAEGTPGYEILYVLPQSYRDDPSRMQEYYNLSEETLQMMQDKWLKLSIDDTEGVTNYGTIIFLGLVGAGIVAYVVYYGRKLFLWMRTRRSKKAAVA